jgi:hypothetical protein
LKYWHSKNVIVFAVCGELSATCSTCTKFHKFIRLRVSCHTDISIVFSRFRSEKRRVASSCLLVLPYAHIRTTPNERIFVKFYVCFLLKFVENSRTFVKI